MKIHWHMRAAAQLHQVEEYVLRDFGERIRQEFMDEVEQATLSLAEMPTMGKIDPLFARRIVSLDPKVQKAGGLCLALKGTPVSPADEVDAY